MLRTLPVVFLMALAAVPVVALADVQPFDGTSVRTIEQRHAGQAFLVAIWATDCAPCRRELALLAENKRRYPDFPFILVATDPISNRDSVLDILAEYGLDTGDVWVFAEPNVERLRYSIDPGWFGEVPRSYYYNRRGERQAFSGPLDAERLLAWFAGTTDNRPDAGNEPGD